MLTWACEWFMNDHSFHKRAPRPSCVMSVCQSSDQASTRSHAFFFCCFLLHTHTHGAHTSPILWEKKKGRLTTPFPKTNEQNKSNQTLVLYLNEVFFYKLKGKLCLIFVSSPLITWYVPPEQEIVIKGTGKQGFVQGHQTDISSSVSGLASSL